MFPVYTDYVADAICPICKRKIAHGSTKNKEKVWVMKTHPPLGTNEVMEMNVSEDPGWWDFYDEEEDGKCQGSGLVVQKIGESHAVHTVID